MFKKIFYKGEETNYSVSEEGKIMNDKTGKELAGTYYSCEYHKVQLLINGVPKTFMVHRLVAETFLPNPENLPVVHHIDGNKLNNHVSNLQWVSAKENAQHKFSFKEKDLEKTYVEEIDDSWKPLLNLDGYLANAEGLICNKKTKRILKGTDRNGYIRVSIKDKPYSAHVLIYEAFYGPIPTGMVIDHINGNRSDNRLENLRCVSQSENMINAHRNGHKNQTKISQYDLEHNFIQQYNTISEAAKKYGVTPAAIRSAAKRHGTSCGFYWEL